MTLKAFCDNDVSCKFAISNIGELQLSVCGDVHLDLCNLRLRKLLGDVVYDISDSNFAINEVVSDENNSIIFSKY